MIEEVLGLDLYIHRHSESLVHITCQSVRGYGRRNKMKLIPLLKGLGFTVVMLAGIAIYLLLIKFFPVPTILLFLLVAVYSAGKLFE